MLNVSHLLGDCADGSLALVLLLLFDCLDGEILALLPGDVAALAVGDLGALEVERVVLVGLALHHVLLGQHAVCEVVVGGEVEVEGEALDGEERGDL